MQTNGTITAATRLRMCERPDGRILHEDLALNRQMGRWLGQLWWRCRRCGSDVSTRTMLRDLRDGDSIRVTL